MATEHVNSFVGKFLSLWNMGEDVSLTVMLQTEKPKGVFQFYLGGNDDLSKLNESTNFSPTM